MNQAETFEWLRKRVQELESELEAARERERWIPVTPETMPKMNQDVLVWFGNLEQPYFDVWRYDNSNQYFRVNTPKSAERDKVTHWKPLSAPPDKEAK